MQIVKSQPQNCLFCEIIQGRIETFRIYESNNLVAILDINPVALGHMIIMPRNHFQFISQIPNDIIYEIFSFVKECLKRVGRDGLLPAGAILTGGAVKAPGTLDLAREVLGLPVQMGFPADIGGVIEKVDDPAYATALGTLVWGAREGQRAYGGNAMLGAKRALVSVKSWFRNLLP